MATNVPTHLGTAEELVPDAPLFITANGHSWLLYHAKPPASRAEFIYANSSAFIPGLKAKCGLFLLPCALGIITKSLQYKGGGNTLWITDKAHIRCNDQI